LYLSPTANEITGRVDGQVLPNTQLLYGRPVVLPPGLNQAQVDRLGGRNTVAFNLTDSSFIPQSPGPTLSLYDPNNNGIDGSDYLGNPQLVPGDPDRHNPNLLQIPPATHPNPSDTRALSSIPTVSVFAGTDPIDFVFSCMELIPETGQLCQRAANMICEDSRHDTAVPVCDECNTASRARFETMLAEETISMRAYACNQCVDVATDARSFQGRSMKVWGFPPTAFNSVGNAFAPQSASRSMGGPLRLSGCDCATKLLDRRVCTAHRLEHFLDVVRRVREMKRYVIGRWTRNVCPFCLQRPGTDAYGFQGHLGGETRNQAWSCMACLALVVFGWDQHNANRGEVDALCQHP
jgi:hypothetical protein